MEEKSTPVGGSNPASPVPKDSENKPIDGTATPAAAEPLKTDTKENAGGPAANKPSAAQASSPTPAIPSPAGPKPPAKNLPPRPGTVPTKPTSAPVKPLPPGSPVGSTLRRLKGPRKHKFLAMAVFFAVVGGGMWGTVKVYQTFFSKGTADKKTKSREAGGQEAMAVNVLEVKVDRFQDTLVAVGTIAGGSEIPLRFEIEGPIDYFEFREGDKVRKGDIISRLNQRDAYLKMKRAELELDQYERLYAIGGVARARLEEARLAADLARSDLEKTILRAHRDGILGDKNAEVGEFVTPQKKIATLVNIETVIVRVGIIEKEIDKVFPGQKVMLTVDTYPGVEFTGRVENISPLVQGTSKTLTVEARLDNEGGLLLPGMFARTRIVVFEEDSAVVVPNDALEKTQTGFRVFVATKDNKAEARDVEVGYVSSQFSQVTAGLSAGELVVTQKPQDLKPGAPVKIIEVQK